MNFLTQNLGTALTGLVLLAIVAAIVLNIALGKKKNRCAGCTSCAGCTRSCERNEHPP